MPRAARLNVDLTLNDREFLIGLQRANAALARSSSSMSRSMSSLSGALNATIGGLRGLAAAYVGLTLIKTADEFASLKDRVKLATEAQGDFAQVWETLVSQSKTTGVALENTASMFIKMAEGMRELGHSDKEILGVTGTLTKLIAISKAGPEQISGAMLGLSQGLGQSRLQAAEWNQVLEGMPSVAAAIVRGFQKLHPELAATNFNFKQLIIDGKIVGFDIFPAIQRVTEDTDKKFASLTTTVAMSTSSLNLSFSELVNGIMEGTHALDILAWTVNKVGSGLDLLAEKMRSLRSENFVAALVHGMGKEYAYDMRDLEQAREQQTYLAEQIGKMTEDKATRAEPFLGLVITNPWTLEEEARLSKYKQQLQETVVVVGELQAAEKKASDAALNKALPVPVIPADAAKAKEAKAPRVKQSAEEKAAIKEARALEAAGIREEKKLYSEAEQAKDSLRSAEEEYAAALAKTQEFLEAGLITKQQAIELDQRARQQMLATSENAAKGWELFNAQLAEDVKTTSSEVAEVFMGMTDGMADAMAQFATEGTLSFKSMADAIIADIVRMTTKYLIFKALKSSGLAASSGSGSDSDELTALLMADTMHSGGIAGSGGVSRIINSSVFSGAPRYHNGNYGLFSNEVPAILQKGELVLSKDDTKALMRGGQKGGTVNNYSVRVDTPTGTLSKASQSQLLVGLTRAARANGRLA